MKNIVKQIALAAVVVTAIVVYACGKSTPVSTRSDAGLPGVARITDEAGTVPVASAASAAPVETEGVRFGGPICIPGTGTGQAQDATAQCIAATYGLTVPAGGTGTGLCQDATLQAILGVLTDGGITVTLDGDVRGPSNNNVVDNVTATNFWTTTPSATVNTTNATPTAIGTAVAIAAATTEDFYVQLGAQNTSGTGDWFFAEYRFAYQRNGAGPVLVGSAPVALNLRGSTTGQTYPGLTETISSNTIVLNVTGLAATNITWNIAASLSHVP